MSRKRGKRTMEAPTKTGPCGIKRSYGTYSYLSRLAYWCIFHDPKTTFLFTTVSDKTPRESTRPGISSPPRNEYEKHEQTPSGAYTCSRIVTRLHPFSSFRSSNFCRPKSILRRLQRVPRLTVVRIAPPLSSFFSCRGRIELQARCGWRKPACRFQQAPCQLYLPTVTTNIVTRGL